MVFSFLPFQRGKEESAREIDVNKTSSSGNQTVTKDV
jgi:hypothetical protein